MSTVRRIKTESQGAYRPHFIVVEHTRKLAISPWKTLLWCLVALSIVLTLVGAHFALQFVKEHLVLHPVPATTSHPLIYPGAQNVTTKVLSGGGKEILFSTNDTDEQVMAFYDQALTMDGWEFLGAIDAPCAPQYIYNWRSIGGYEVGDYWGFYIRFPSSNEVTVTVAKEAVPCGDLGNF